MGSETAVVRPVRVRCPLGGSAPCCDDLCHAVDTTICGLERYYDFCDHGFLPDTCPDCREEDLDDWTFEADWEP